MNASLLSSRRSLLKACAFGGFWAALGRLQWMNAFADPPQGEDYKALVCVFLFGGNDSLNMIFPTPGGGAAFSKLLEARKASQTGVNSGMLPNSSDYPVKQSLFGPNNSTSTTVPFCVNPVMRDLDPMFGTSAANSEVRMAFVENVGPLISKGTAFDSIPRPDRLFSHEDQQEMWQSGFPTYASKVENRELGRGWLGRIAERFLSDNPSGGTQEYLTAVSLFGSHTLLAGQALLPYLTTGSATGIGTDWTATPVRTLYNTPNNYLGTNNLLEREYTRRLGTMLLREDEVAGWIGTAGAYAPITPAPNSVEADWGGGTTPPIAAEVAAATSSRDFLDRQLEAVFKLIKQRKAPTVDYRRQVFMVGLGGFDTHFGRNTSLLWAVSQSIKRFYDNLTSVPNEDLHKKVTLFTASDFARTAAASQTGGSFGTDHAWGATHIVVGGAVQPGYYTGRDDGNGTPITIATELAASVATPPTNVFNGSVFAPTIANDEYFATLGKWFGVSQSSLEAILPGLKTNPTWRSDLGFMGA